MSASGSKRRAECCPDKQRGWAADFHADLLVRLAMRLACRSLDKKSDSGNPSRNCGSGKLCARQLSRSGRAFHSRNCNDPQNPCKSYNRYHRQSVKDLWSWIFGTRLAQCAQLSAEAAVGEACRSPSPVANRRVGRSIAARKASKSPGERGKSDKCNSVATSRLISPH